MIGKLLIPANHEGYILSSASKDVMINGLPIILTLLNKYGKDEALPEKFT